MNAQDQGHYTNAFSFNKMAELSQSDKRMFCGVETESTSHLSRCKKTHVRTALHRIT